jgi:hypothetical protein
MFHFCLMYLVVFFMFRMFLMKEIMILNHVCACMFFAGGVLGSCRRGKGRAMLVVSAMLRDLDMSSGASLFLEIST